MKYLILAALALGTCSMSQAFESATAGPTVVATFSILMNWPAISLLSNATEYKERESISYGASDAELVLAGYSEARDYSTFIDAKTTLNTILKRNHLPLMEDAMDAAKGILLLNEQFSSGK